MAWEMEGAEKSQPPGDTVDSVPWYRSCRLLLAVIAFLGFFHAYAQRVGMSVAIVCMVNHTALSLQGDAQESGHDNGFNVSMGVSMTTASFYNSTTTRISSLPQSCADRTSGSNDEKNDGPFVWDKELQGHILGSFYYGYLVSQIPGGMLAEKYGGKWIFAGFSALTLATTLLTPMASRVSPYFLIVLRVLSGVGSGVLFPAMHALWSQWAPPLERTKLAGISYSGAWMGNVISLPIAGILCHSGFDGGWPSVFYVIGMSTAVWLTLWVLFVSNNPTTHSRIHPKEKEYIISSLQGQIDMKKEKDMSKPWLKILTSMPVWAVVLGNITTDWGLYIFLTNIPTYLHEVLNFNIQANGALSALPFIGCWIAMNIAPIIADKLMTAKIMSPTNVRKMMMGIGCFGAAAFLVALAFVRCDQVILAVALLTLGVTISGCVYSGFLVNYMDIAPKYAGTLIGIGNCLASACGFAAPYTVAVMTTNQRQDEWQRVFFVAAAIYVFGGLFFALFASGEVQSWAKEPYDVQEVKVNGDQPEEPVKKPLLKQEEESTTKV